jgi:hypothetical protein
MGNIVEHKGRISRLLVRLRGKRQQKPSDECYNPDLLKEIQAAEASRLISQGEASAIVGVHNIPPMGGF